MPKYLNTNRHEIYVDDPADDTQDLTRIGPGREVTATGTFADNLEQTPGVFRAGSDEAKAFKRGEKVKGDNLRKYPAGADELLATDGEHAFPAEEQEIVTPSQATPEQTPEAIAAQEYGQEIAERQEGANVNFASDEAGEKAEELGLNPRDLADRTGSGKDGALTVKDVKEIADELSTTPENLDGASEEQLTDLATEFGIDVDGLLADVPDDERREKLQEAVQDAGADTATTAAANTENPTATNEPPEGGTVTSDKVPKAS